MDVMDRRYHGTAPSQPTVASMYRNDWLRIDFRDFGYGWEPARNSTILFN
jgi:hypothetical protein